MGVFHDLEIVQMVPNRAKHHYNNPLTQYLLEISMIIFFRYIRRFSIFLTKRCC